MWERLPLNAKLSVLSAETTVMAELLAEDDELIAMLKRGESKETCVQHINQEY